MCLRGVIACVLALGTLGCGGGNTPECFDVSGCGDGDADGDADTLCDDVDLDGFISTECFEGTDCDDHDRHLNPDEEEVCNGIDDDCSGEVDEGMLDDGEDIVLPLVDPLAHTELIAFAGDALGFGLLRLECSANCLENDVATAERHLTFIELQADGEPTGEPIEISATANFLPWESVALAALPGGGWLVAWTETPDGVATFTDARVTIASIIGGQVSEPLYEASRRGGLSPVLAVGADTVAAVWNQGDETIEFAVLDLDDLSLVDEGTLFDQSLPPGGRESVAWTGERYVAAGGGDYLGSVGADGSASAGPLAHAWASPAVAWTGFEGGLVHYEAVDRQVFQPVDANGVAGRSVEIAVVGANAERLVGAPRTFALTGVVGGEDNKYNGEATFWNLGPRGGVSNEIEVDDAGGETFEEDVWAAPTGDAGAWALAWIDADRHVRIDFVRCQD